MSVLLAREMESIKEQSKSPRSGRHSSRAGSRDKSILRPRDTIRHINEKAAAAAAVAAMDTDEVGLLQIFSFFNACGILRSHTLCFV